MAAASRLVPPSMSAAGLKSNNPSSSSDDEWLLLIGLEEELVQGGDRRDSRTRSVSTSIIAMGIIVDASTSCSSEIALK